MDLQSPLFTTKKLSYSVIIMAAGQDLVEDIALTSALMLRVKVIICPDVKNGLTPYRIR